MCTGPGNRHLTCTDATLGSDLKHGVEDQCALRGVFRLENLAAKAFGTAFLALSVLAGQHAAAQRRPGHDAQAKRVRGLKKISLGLAVHQAVLELRGCNW